MEFATFEADLGVTFSVFNFVFFLPNSGRSPQMSEILLTGNISNTLNKNQFPVG